MTPAQIIAHEFEHVRCRRRQQKPVRVVRLYLGDDALDVIGELAPPAFAAPEFRGFRLADVVAGLSVVTEKESA